MTSDHAGHAPACDAPKRRACDECRSRKLACSKESDGCSRCKREGIACHYSPQKPMGRPRKRRHIDDSPPLNAEVDVDVPVKRRSVERRTGGGRGGKHGVERHSVEKPGFLDASPPFAGVNGNFDALQPAMSIDPAMNFWDPSSNSTSMAFLDLLPDNFLQDNIHSAHTIQPCAEPFVANGDSYDNNAFSLSLNGPDPFSGVQFDEPDPSAATVAKDINDSMERYMSSLQHAAPIASYEHPEPTDSSPSNMSRFSDMSHSVESHSVESPEALPAPTLRAIPTVSCGCLSSLYLALDSLSHLPTDIASAMRVVRNASKVAHDVVNCRFCYEIEDPTKPPPIQCFQNLMCLGALIPSVCNAYAYIMEMVDHQTALAKRERRSLWFSFKEIGGLWGDVVNDNGACSMIQAYNNKHLSPELWRSTFRAILRLDVYGLEGREDTGPNAVSPSSAGLGLKNVMTQLDEKTRKRHDTMEALIVSGQMQSPSPYILFQGCNKPIPVDQRNCVRVLEMARTALDQLVIS